MKLYRIINLASVTILYSYLILGCGGQIKMEQCKFIGIESRELELELGEIDAEEGTVKMICGDQIIDVSWAQFQRKLRVNPKKYADDLVAFKREVYCLINESSQDQIVFCSRPSLSKNLVGLKFQI